MSDESPEAAPSRPAWHDDALARAWSHVRQCQRCGGLAGGGRKVCALCLADEMANDIIQSVFAK